ncbi:sugar ABC transporter substrate-binding protein [Ectobacillus antri]|jgi:simple sugar transport system substrate-binding protein|uniref:Sugar ABC transporter substrate-binding protein n=1 Tax=Ectobacillus antri TaxID=2486280 RepID=A0ABT6HA51_9BACI|nr:sugar ABC transporter substrate-binding protein [Ectobacillus antri]MDG4658165.1 sugar ABC transporter substrate-binding protein [Ectobacillus antri]MDG5755241.1 sugar ABC transporter substrate-binding protein [Ectobacillus antri]
MKKWAKAILLTSVLTLVACTNEQDAAPTQKQTSTKQEQKATVSTNTEIPDKVQKPLKIALIMQMSIGTFSSQYIEGVKKQVEAFGGTVQVYNSDNDLAKMATNLDTAINAKVDGILIDHGRSEALKNGVEKALAANIPVVAFDNDLRLPGVTVIDQDDYSLAWKSLKTLAEDLNGTGEIAVLWVGGFAPMERRSTMIDAFYKRYPNIKEVARFGTASNNTALDTQTQVEALLKKYPKKGDLDAIFATWDEFAKGATKALEQAGRTDIKVYGIDLSNEDLQLIQKENSPWAATAATNPAEVGRIQTRFLYQKVAGEKTPDVYSLEPYLVKKDQLPSEVVTMDGLEKYIPGWGTSQAAYSPWMSKLEKEQK